MLKLIHRRYGGKVGKSAFCGIFIFELMYHLPKNIFLIRKILRENQTVFGKRFGASKDMIVSYEGKKSIKPDELFMKRLSKLAGVTVSELESKELNEEDIVLEKVKKLPNANSGMKALISDKEYTISDLIAEKDARVLDAKNNTEYLQGLLAFSLHDLSKNQKDMYAHLKGAIKRQAERYSKMDPDKVKAELGIISTYADEIRTAGEKEGIPPQA